MNWFFAIGFICMVAGVVAYLMKENNGYSRLADGVDDMSARAERIEKSVRDAMNNYASMQDQVTRHRELIEKLSDRLQLAEMRIDAESRKQPAVQVPSRIRLEMPQQPIQVIYREGPPAQLKKKPAAAAEQAISGARGAKSLLERAGVKRKQQEASP
jgi:TolA-binding protein